MFAFYQNVVQQLESIEDCLAKGRIISVLCLFYSVIDATASLERLPGDKIRDAFVRWVDENMLKLQPLPCTAVDLYAARCGALHTFTPDSDISRKGQARKLVYAWGKETSEDLARANQKLGRDEVAIHINDLLSAFRLGLERYLERLDDDPARMQAIEKRAANTWFTHLDGNTLKAFLAVPDR